MLFLRLMNCRKELVGKWRGRSRRAKEHESQQQSMSGSDEGLRFTNRIADPDMTPQGASEKATEAFIYQHSLKTPGSEQDPSFENDIRSNDSQHRYGYRLSKNEVVIH